MDVIFRGRAPLLSKSRGTRDCPILIESDHRQWGAHVQQSGLPTPEKLPHWSIRNRSPFGRIGLDRLSKEPGK
jgi:hypothetical protein